MMNYLKSESCRPWQNRVYTLIMWSRHERKTREMVMTGGDGLCTHHNLLLTSNCCRTWGRIPAVSISKACGLYSHREADIV